MDIFPICATTIIINLYQIQSLVSAGPNLKMKDKEMLEEEPKYFSVRWFLSGENAQRAGYGSLWKKI